MEGDSELADLYRDVLIDYFRDDTFKGVIENPDITAHGVNPTCGDEIKISIATEGGCLKDIRFTGHGCVISQASSGMMCEGLEGKTIDEAVRLVGAFRKMMLENSPIEDLPEAISEVEALEGVRKFPIRVKCALLAWITCLQGLEGALKGEPKSEYMEAG